MSDTNKFEFTAKQKRTFLIMMGAGIIAVLIGLLAGGVTGQRFWANLLLESVFFTGIAACAIFMIAAHHIGMAGWTIAFKRVSESLSLFTRIGAIFIIVIAIGTAAGYHHLYHWSDTFLQEKTVTQSELDEFNAEHAGEHEMSHEAEAHAEEHNVVLTANDHPEPNADGTIENPYYDKILDGKSAYLNSTAFIIRTLIYLILWVFIAYKLRQVSLQEELGDGGEKWYMKTKFWSAIFLVIWAVSSSMMTWDWVMSLDPHWYSTLFGWYTFCSLWIACISVITLLLIYLKSKGYMKEVNENHLHDLGKYAFGFSIFWTYMWFSQFMLYWYGNIPEETKWYLFRKREYYPLFFGNLIINFLVPFLALMRRDSKRSLSILTIVSIILIIGHWNDFFVMIMPATVKEDWHINYFEIGMFLLFAGMFLYSVFHQLAKAPLNVRKHLMYKETLDHHQ